MVPHLLLRQELVISGKKVLANIKRNVKFFTSGGGNSVFVCDKKFPTEKSIQIKTQRGTEIWLIFAVYRLV